MSKWMLSTLILLVILIAMAVFSFSNIQNVVARDIAPRPSNEQEVGRGCGVEGQPCNGYTTYCCLKGGNAYEHTCNPTTGTWDAGGWCARGQICSRHNEGGQCTDP